jgi:hypothetical protein
MDHQVKQLLAEAETCATQESVKPLTYPLCVRTLSMMDLCDGGSLQVCWCLQQVCRCAHYRCVCGQVHECVHVCLRACMHACVCLCMDVQKLGLVGFVRS